MTTQTPTKPTVPTINGAVLRPEGRSTRQSQQAPFAPSAFYPPDQPAPVPREPGLTDPHHRLLQTLTSPEVSTITLCEIHTLTLAQIAELTGSETFEDALAAAERIAQFRLRLLKLEAEQLAWARLTDLARRHPVTPGEQETSRKAAAQILRETKKPAPASPGLRGGAGEVPERSAGGGGLQPQRNGSVTSSANDSPSHHRATASHADHANQDRPGTPRTVMGMPACKSHERNTSDRSGSTPTTAPPSTNPADNDHAPTTAATSDPCSAPPKAPGRPPPGAG